MGLEDDDIRHLKALVSRAFGDAGILEGRGLPRSLAVWEMRKHLGPDFTDGVLRCTSYIRRSLPDLHAALLYESEWIQLIIDALVDGRDDVTLSRFLADLNRRVGGEGEWLVSIPIVGTHPIGAPVKVSTQSALIPTPVPTAGQVQTVEDYDREVEIDGLLGDFVRSRGRRQYDEARELRETLAGTTMLLVVAGRETIALSRAETRARYLVALWCLLAPPRTGSIWPEPSEWHPGQNIRSSRIRKPYEPNVPRHERQRQANDHRDFYDLWEVPDQEVLDLGERVVQMAEGGDRGAAAIASAARSLFLAMAHPRMLERTERIVFVQQALEALADPQDWDRLFDRTDAVSSVCARGYDEDDVKEAIALTRKVRNIGAHYAEDVFVNLGLDGWRVEMRHNKTLDSTEGHLAAVQFNAPIVLLVATEAVRGALRHAETCEWSPDWMTALTSPPEKT